jgi:hypothetical protein
MVVGILEWEGFYLISATWSVMQLILGGLDERRTSRHLCQKEKKNCDPETKTESEDLQASGGPSKNQIRVCAACRSPAECRYLPRD